jgi:hypothetical protein
MAQDVYSRVAEKMKNEQFTEDEIRIVAKAKEQISSYSKQLHPRLVCLYSFIGQGG